MTYPTKHQEGRSALSLAAEKGCVDVMKVLIEKGADVNTQNKVIIYKSLHIHQSHAQILACTNQKNGLVTFEGFPGLKGYLNCIRVYNSHVLLWFSLIRMHVLFTMHVYRSLH